MNSEFAARVLLPDNDPTEEAEQNRMQKLELVLLGHGEAVPVSPRDSHKIHLQVLMPATEQVASQMMQGQFPASVLETLVAHVNEHYTQAIRQGTKPAELAEVAQFLSKVGPELAKLKQIDQQAAQVADAHRQITAGDQPA